MSNKTVLLAGALFAVTSACFAEIRALTPQVPDADWTKPWWGKRHAEKMSSVTNGGAKVVFLGDSITHFWETNGKEQLARYYGTGDLKMLDLGFSGDRTEHVLWRLTVGKELDGYEAKVVFLMIGTNNAGHFPFEKEPPIDTILGIREILRVIRTKQPTAKIVLTAIFPRGADANDGCRRRNEVVNRAIMSFADGKDIIWLDFNGQFMTLDGRLPREVFPDLLHPGGYGYELWASATLPYARAAVAGEPLPPSRYAPFLRPGDVRIDEPKACFPGLTISGLKDRSLDRFQECRRQVSESKGQIDLVFLGDETMADWEDQGKASLAELRETYSVLNLGFPGDETGNLLWRVENGALDGYKAKCVMVSIGRNNSCARRKDPNEPTDMVNCIRTILDVIARKQPAAKTLLLPIIPSCHEWYEQYNRQVNARIKAFADGKKVIWVDFNDKVIKLAKARNQNPGPTPSADCYREAWMPAVLPHFEAICGKSLLEVE